MSSFFDRILGKDRHSASLAKERLKLVLIHDRTDLTPSALNALKDELIEVISRYVEIDPHQHLLASHVHVLNGPFGHGLVLPSNETRIPLIAWKRFPAASHSDSTSCTPATRGT